MFVIFFEDNYYTADNCRYYTRITFIKTHKVTIRSIMYWDMKWADSIIEKRADSKHSNKR